MVDCDTCGDEVIHVWRHRTYSEEMTHRDVSWVCADCHPELPERMKHEAPESETAEAEPEADERVVMTDGGRFACPDCAGETVNGQGLFGCLDCGWSGPC